MHPYLLSITKEFKKNANPLKAADFHAYMMQQFDFFGIKTPQRRHLCKIHFKTHPIKTAKELELIVKEAWNLHLREYQYYAIELLIHNKKLWNEKTITLIHFCLSTKSWWDTVDPMVAGLLAPYFAMYPQHIIPYSAKWNKSNNMWLQRCSIMFQKHFKSNTDKALLSKYILAHIDSEEYHIHRSIAWALRQYSKINPQWVTDFVEEHGLSGFIQREAMKVINNNVFEQ